MIVRIIFTGWDRALLLVQLILFIHVLSSAWSTGNRPKGKLAFIKVEISIVGDRDVIDDLVIAWVVATSQLVVAKWTPAAVCMRLTECQMTALISSLKLPSVDGHSRGYMHATSWRVCRLWRSVECLVLCRGHLRNCVLSIKEDALRAVFVFHMHHWRVLPWSCFCNAMAILLRLVFQAWRPYDTGLIPRVDRSTYAYVRFQRRFLPDNILACGDFLSGRTCGSCVIPKSSLLELLVMMMSGSVVVFIC